MSTGAIQRYDIKAPHRPYVQNVNWRYQNFYYGDLTLTDQIDKRWESCYYTEKYDSK